MKFKFAFRPPIRSGFQGSSVTTVVVALLSIASSTRCTTSEITKEMNGSQTKFEKALAQGRCTDAAENIPENDGSIKFLGRVDRATGTVISYAATGAGYTADVALTIVGGAILYSVLTLPIALPTQPVYAGDPSYPKAAGDINLPTSKLGSAIYNGTSAMRCPDLTALSTSVRRVAACLSKQTDKVENLTSAKKTLDSVAGNRDIMNCITPEERSAVQSAKYNIEQMILRLPAATSSLN